VRKPFFATTLNHIDRQVIGILRPELAKELGWNEIDYSNIVFAFSVAYAIGYVGAGRLIDRLGVRLEYALAVLFWSLAIIHGLNPHPEPMEFDASPVTQEADFQGSAWPSLAVVAVFWALVGSGFVGIVRDNDSLLLRRRDQQ
jgi:MFS family permease